MKLASRKRFVGIGMAWLAAYALVLNGVLTSVLHAAAVSPSTIGLGHILCINSADGDGAARDDTGTGGKRASAHCPLCVGNHSPVALPSPPLPVIERTASHTAIMARADDLIVALARFTDNQARGTPRHV